MGYNIGEVTGYAGGPSDWTMTADLSDPSVTTVTGDFDLVSLVTGQSVGEANSYSIAQFSANFGTYTNNFVLNPDGSFSFDIDRQAVIQSGVDQTVSFTIVGRTGSQSDDDTVTVTLLICLAGGTLVKTEKGQVPVEDLRVGDLVPTVDDGMQRIRWVGSRSLTAGDLQDNPNLRPIRITAGALGDGRPKQDLLVSPQHRVLIGDWRVQLFLGEDEALVPAKGLVDGQNIYVDDTVEDVDYYHVLFDSHQVIFTNGTPTESFHPADYSLGAIDADMRAELLELFPEIEADSGYRMTARFVARVKEAKLLTQVEI
ncbi:Hint domain-containing protein [Ruegeria sediminis]|uniref:Hint domain-containing protein n=1 Tax=Ruegeria sediminis TaxID=2583820 RepID=A0ABY2X3F3_9RHOB|nr:Hint domain-containing protein [Ruegeria sediminis]TMV09919.1 Hint domain-containing protein [Ruegeria sediminis]